MSNHKEEEFSLYLLKNCIFEIDITEIIRIYQNPVVLYDFVLHSYKLAIIKPNKMLKKLFSKNEPKSYGPSEPIYPGETFEVSEITDDNGFFGISNINKSYDNYPNKKYFQWWVQVTLELVDTDDRKMPTESESRILSELEDKIEKFIKEKHKTHFIGRVTQNGFRDIIFYIDQPRFDQEKTNLFFDEIQEQRRVNFNMEKDSNWNNVDGLIK